MEKKNDLKPKQLKNTNVDFAIILKIEVRMRVLWLFEIQKMQVLTGNFYFLERSENYLKIYLFNRYYVIIFLFLGLERIRRVRYVRY